MDQIALGNVTINRIEEMHGPIGMTPDQFHASYSVLVRITPDNLRGF